MNGLLSALSPSEVALPIIALLGLALIAVQYRAEAKWFAVGYVVLFVGTIATNAEAIVLGDALNFVEHFAGIMGAALVFLYAVYDRRKRTLRAGTGG